MIHLPRATRPSIGWAVCLLVSLLGLNACSTALPEGASAVTPFDINRYQGKWYEIARPDHSFERGFSDVTANYRLLPDGSEEVINRGYDGNRNEWRQVTGHALFIGEANRASLKVSFFGPFYAGYHVIALDQQHYRWAMVIGPSRDYLWILTRDKQLAADVREPLVERARALGIDIEKMIWVDQRRNDH